MIPFTKRLYLLIVCIISLMQSCTYYKCDAPMYHCNCIKHTDTLDLMIDGYFAKQEIFLLYADSGYACQVSSIDHYKTKQGDAPGVNIYKNAKQTIRYYENLDYSCHE